MNSVWGQDDYFTEEVWMFLLQKLRKYLKEDSDVLIENVHGIALKLSIKAHDFNFTYRNGNQDLLNFDI